MRAANRHTSIPPLSVSMASPPPDSDLVRQETLTSTRVSACVLARGSCAHTHNGPFRPAAEGGVPQQTERGSLATSGPDRRPKRSRREQRLRPS